MSRYIESWWVEELPNGVIKLVINCKQKEIYYQRLNDYQFIIAGSEEEFNNWEESVLFSVSEFLPSNKGIYLKADSKNKDQLYFFYIPHLKEWVRNRKILIKS